MKFRNFDQKSILEISGILEKNQEFTDISEILPILEEFLEFREYSKNFWDFKRKGISSNFKISGISRNFS
jgi:hypothetical protein